MADITWPPTLPDAPRLAELERRIGRKVIRTEMDRGPAKARRGFTFAPERFPIVLHMTADQVATFIDFFDNTSEGGALPFDWKHPTLRTEATVRFRDEPVIKPLSTFASTKATHQVSFEIETMAPEVETIVEPGTSIDYDDQQGHTYDGEGMGGSGGPVDLQPADDGSAAGTDGEGSWDGDRVAIVNP
ncbi:MAG TPA: hypothetical protein VK176_01685 [Phycisphaerales bacterium]|nr:hypothetical protein [Phycisphaerales bacterium]